MSPRNAAVNGQMRDRAKTKILDAAYALFKEQGYDATTLAQIARRAGVSVGLTVYYFRTKQHLIQALADKIVHATVVHQMRSLPEDTGADERLAALIDSILQAAAAEPKIVALHLALLLQPGVSELLHDAEHHYEEELGLLTWELLAARGDDPLLAQQDLRNSLMGAAYGIVSPYQPLPLAIARARLFAQYGLEAHPDVPSDAVTHPSHDKPAR